MGQCLQVCVVIVNENGPDNRLKLTMLAEYAVRQCANGRAKVLALGGVWQT